MSHDPRRDGSPHDRADAHEHARTLLAERLTEQIDAADVAWLEEHLGGCEPCRAVDAEYRADRRELRMMSAPEPPRDLWARTSAALDAERRRHPRRDEVVARGSRSPGGARTVRLTPPISLGIAAVIVGAFLVGSQLGPSAQSPSFALGSPATTTVPSGLAGLATPIAVAGGDVAWSVRAPDGTYTVQEAPVNQVCPSGATADCTPLDTNSQGVAAIPVTPKSVYASSAMHQFVVLGNKVGSNGMGLYVVSVGAPTASPSPTASVRPSASASPTATPSPAATPTPTPQPSTSPAASGATGPSASPTTRPSATTAPSPSGSVPPASATPAPSASASAEPTPSIAPATLPPGTPAPTAAAVLAIASNLTVLGVTAAYSPDGTWFAFTARDSAADTGSDIYLWHVGEDHAIAATTDHRSVYAGWAAGRIVGSRAPAKAGSSETVATSFLLDPTSLDATDLATPAWRPVVDPTGTYAVYWSGTVVLDPATGGWTTGTGRLVLAPWAALSDSTAGPGHAASPSASAGSTPASSAAPSVTPIELPTDVASAAGVEWDAHWDETGSHLAIWVADRADPSLGHLDLVTIDRKTGLADPAGPSQRGLPALAGFALGGGHLAWATPPGQDGQGSTLQVFAWSGPDAGRTSSQAAGGSDPVIVVQH